MGLISAHVGGRTRGVFIYRKVLRMSEGGSRIESERAKAIAEVVHSSVALIQGSTAETLAAKHEAQ